MLAQQLDYFDAINRLFTTNLFGGMKVGLENIKALDVQLKHPHSSYPCIHIAGSNGKGSVAGKISKTLELAGYKVGLFTSPHISCFRERIKVCGEMISKEEVVEGLERIFAFVDQKRIPATFFEITTALAFCYFQKKKVDVAVIETGLGGRLDATNVITPILSVITSVSKEHTQVLGESLTEIAREKAGIIKPAVPVVVGPRAYREVVQSVAARCGSLQINVEEGGTTFERENCRIAQKALEELSKRFCLNQEHISLGLRFQMPCRFQVFERNHLQKCCTFSAPEALILDVAHNPDALQKLFSRVQRKFPEKKYRVLLALSRGKDLNASIEAICAHTNEVHLLEAANGRGFSLSELEKECEFQGLKVVSQGKDVDQILREAMILSGQREEVLIVCGSFFIMSSVRKFLGIQEATDAFDMNERLLVS